MMPSFLYFYMAAFACGINGGMNLLSGMWTRMQNDSIGAVVDLSLCLAFFLLGTYKEQKFRQAYRKKMEK